MTTLGVYAKAVAAFIASTLGAVGSWFILIGDGPVSRAEWGGLIIAIGGVIGATVGVAVTTNAGTGDDTGASPVGLVLAVLIVICVLALFGATGHPLLLLLLIVAALVLLL